MDDDQELTFPDLDPVEEQPWQWPVPPFAWRRLALPPQGTTEPCLIESANGTSLAGDAVGIDVPAGRLLFRTAPDAASLSVPLARIRRLILTMPLTSVETPLRGVVERLPAAAQEREYRLYAAADDAAPRLGRTAGHVETADGLFLFEPLDEHRAVRRVFVPRTAYQRCEFGRSAQEAAAERWIASPVALRAALARQQHMTLRPIGQSLLELGLLTVEQLDRALARQTDALPLGEALVAAGLLAPADLQTALAHKMGVPMIDLARFEIDAEARLRLAPRIVLQARALPVLLDGQRLVVAVDRPSRADKLRALLGHSTLEVVPVLAARGQLELALAHYVQQQDVWADNVTAPAPLFMASGY